MLLAIDVGNTHTVFGLFEDDRLRADWRIATRKEATARGLGVRVAALFAESGLERARVRDVIVSSVVPDLNRAIDELAREHFGCAALFVGPGVKTGMPILYDNPHEVGADRIVNALAAATRYGAPVIVLD